MDDFKSIADLVKIAKRQLSFRGIEIADNDIKFKKIYNDAKRIEQMKHISIHDALYSLIRNGKV